MAAIESAYQYYLSAYGPSNMTRYDTHKKSQLRDVYNNIVKTNKDAPLYKIKYSRDVGRFAIDIKEKTRSIQNLVASLSETDGEGGAEQMFARKIAQSSDEESVGAEYVGESQDVDDDIGFEVEVKSLASPQTNTGNYLDPNKSAVAPGSYSFNLTTNYSSYEFQCNVATSDTNQKVQEKLARLVNNSNVGLNATILENERGQKALSISSIQTGLSDNERFLFEIMPTPDSDSIRAIRALGIDHVTQTASNSSFLLNGVEHTSLSNTFTVNNAFELTLRKPSPEGQPAKIGFKPNAEAIADNVQSLVDVYNNIIKLSHDYRGTQQSSNKLLNDMSSVAKHYYNELEAIGIQLREDGSLTIDRSLLTDAVSAPDAEESFATLNAFKDGLNRRAAAASIDPMHYVNKLLVAYKRPDHNFATPYITSIYSGMMLDATL